MWTIFDFLKRFAIDLFHAVFFAAIEYDDKLKLTKTPRQRATIWIIIFVIAAIFLYALLHGIWYFLDTLDTSKIKI